MQVKSVGEKSPGVNVRQYPRVAYFPRQLGSEVGEIDDGRASIRQ